MARRSAAPVRGYYFCYFAAQACMASGLNVYLEQALGLGGDALGWFNGLTTLAAAAVLPLLGRWADKAGPARSGWLLTGALGAALAGAGLLGAQTGLAGALAWGVLWECARSACVSLADRSTMEFCGAQGRNYGAVRSFGSLGFLAGGTALGFAARRWGIGAVLFPAYLALAGAAFALSFAFRAPPAAARRESPGPGRSGGLRQLFRLPAFRLALLLTVPGSVAVSALQPYLGSHLITVMGAGESILSWNTLCCVVPELLLLPLVSRALGRWGFAPVGLAVTLALALRCAVYALAPNPWIFLAGSLFYGFSVCGYTAVSLNLLRRGVPREHYALAVLTAAGAATLGRAAFSWLFGALYGSWGSRSIFWLLLGCALGAAALLWRGRRDFPEMER